MNRKENKMTATATNKANRPAGISVNIDCTTFFITHSEAEMNAQTVDDYARLFHGAGVDEVLWNPNAKTTAFASKVFSPVWEGYDPEGGPEQPFVMKYYRTHQRDIFHRSVAAALALHRQGIDPFERWLRVSREGGIKAWLTMRMNDDHGSTKHECPSHGRFWHAHPEFRRGMYRVDGRGSHVFDYAHPEVREYHLALVRELLERYDMDGLELDWMRHEYYFQPGHEAAGVPVLNDFMRQARALVRQAEQRRGHPIALGVRTATTYGTALGLGTDPVQWAREGLIDRLIVTPYFETCDSDIPFEEWHLLLAGTAVSLGATIEANLRPHRGTEMRRNSLETVRGLAASYLHRGAERIYFFNYFPAYPKDSAIGMDSGWHRQAFAEASSLDALRGKSRRHIVTFRDVAAPGTPTAFALPCPCGPGVPVAKFRLHTGPRPATTRATVILSFADAAAMRAGDWVRLNGVLCPAQGPAPNPAAPEPCDHPFAFAVPLEAINEGYNLIEAQTENRRDITWAEIAFSGVA
jgi:hypothetical protein